jgi:hypothetical protein
MHEHCRSYTNYSILTINAVKAGTGRSSGMAPREEEAYGAKAAHDGLMRAANAREQPSADLRGARVLTLLVDDGGGTLKIEEPNKRMSW